MAVVMEATDYSTIVITIYLFIGGATWLYVD